MSKPAIHAAIEYISRLFSDNAGGHDTEHTLRVYRTAMAIADAESACDREIIALAALLHDADDHKLFYTENNENARTFLKNAGIPESRMEQIVETINAVSFSKNQGKVPGTIEAKIVQDADRLDALGAIGIARTFAYGGEHGRPLSDSVQHFYDKLLRLKDLMNTEAAKKIAEKRHQFLLEFLQELEDEQ
ncbi:MAG: HD domain-containing protein [Lachnospiraceae bacterium]|nr:HD domain-containing protein [Lachnospiraceae bacterium]